MDGWCWMACGVLVVFLLVWVSFLQSPTTRSTGEDAADEALERDLRAVFDSFRAAGRLIPEAEDIRGALAGVLSSNDFDELGKIPARERRQFLEDVVGELFGFGPIEALMRDAAVSEIRVKDPATIVVLRAGSEELANCRFRDAAHVLNLFRRFAEPRGKEFNAAQPRSAITLEDETMLVLEKSSTGENDFQLTIRKSPKNGVQLNLLFSR